MLGRKECAGETHRQARQLNTAAFELGGITCSWMPRLSLLQCVVQTRNAYLRQPSFDYPNDVLTPTAWIYDLFRVLLKGLTGDSWCHCRMQRTLTATLLA